MATCCPLCLSEAVVAYWQDKRRSYSQCTQCQLVFVDDAYILSPELEKAEYDKHQNTLHDEGYLNFLSRLAVPLSKKLNPASIGIDIGCGPVPAFATLMAKQGHEMAVYDLYYHPDESVFGKDYQFVTATEVIEHIKDAQGFVTQLVSLLKNGGYIGLMTKLVIDPLRFQTWHYKNDLTHIRFYSRATFEFIARKYHLDIEFVGQDVILLHKPQS